jgi:ribosomal protein S27E
MSKIGKIAKCSGCGQEKPIFSELDDSRENKIVYCENCVKYNHEKIKCERCGQLLLLCISLETEGPLMTRPYL